MSMTLNVRKAEWDLIRANHQSQRQLRCIKQAGHKTAPDLMSKLQKILAMQEPSTQDIVATAPLAVTFDMRSGMDAHPIEEARVSMIKVQVSDQFHDFLALSQLGVSHRAYVSQG
ncbi:MAG: hypothetical protein GY877_05800 [Hyphomicrobium sp.]|nr:hypothetical protein [Hyphomicrobium sp.]